MRSTPPRRRGAVALVAACATIAAAALGPVGASGDAAPSQPAPAAVPGELLARFDPDTPAAARRASRELAGTRLERRMLLPGLELLRTRPGVQVAAAIAALERAPGVRYAEPNWLDRLQAIPDDPRLAEQWALHNTGQTINGVPGTPGGDIAATQAWDTETGSRDVKVAVIDGGIDHYHPDFAANIWRNAGEAAAGELRNGVDDDENGFTDDLYGWDFIDNDPDPLTGDGHGNAVASVIGATGDNALGVTGVNWLVSLVGLRACSGLCPLDAQVQAISYAALIGADVANMSFGGPTNSTARREAIRAASNTLFVPGAGNSAHDNDVEPNYPCAYELPNVLCVAATNNRDELAAWSSYGATSVDLGAPGEDIMAAGPVYREVFRDDFEDDLAPRWDYTEAPVPADPARWRRVVAPAVGGGASTHVLQDSEGASYADNADTRVTLLAPIDLSGEQGCSVALDATLNTESTKDHLRVEAASAATGPFTELVRASGSPSGRVLVSAPLSGFDGGDVYLRLRLTSDGQSTRDGASVDDVRVLCDDPQAGYGLATGTSFAAPQVAGAAALVKAHMPGISVADLRERLLRTVDRLPTLEGKVVTGGRLNVERALTADLAAPVATIDSAPASLTSSRSASFEFTSSKPGSTFECRVDGEEFAACGSPMTYAELADGEHTFAVRAIDEYGIVGSAAEAGWTVDATAPTATITSGPEGSTTARSASFGFTASEPAAGFECRLDGGAFAECASPASYSDLAAGAHTFAVRARDIAGNWSADPATRTWTITDPPPEDGGGSGSGDGTAGSDGTADPSEPAPREPAPALVAPSLDDPEPKAWDAPTLRVKVPRRQTVRRVRRRGLVAVAAIDARCRCKLTHTLRLDRRLARKAGLIPNRSTRRTRRPRIARGAVRVRSDGRVRTKLRLAKRARARLARAPRLTGILQTRLVDRRGQTKRVRQRVRLRR